MTALRELAERWRAERASDDALQNYETGLADARGDCADELLAILDAEGDGGAMGGCDVCHEPLGDACACRNEYRREHDSGAER